ncbi:MAG: FHA domain-containing protein [Thermodesulfobacteriota bacterium]
MTKLHLLKGPMRGHSFELKGEETTIGRGPENDICIADKSISRKHCRISRKGGRFFVEDLRSRNGTWIHGERLRPGEPYPVEEGLLFAIGDVLVSLGTDYTGAAPPTQYSIGMSQDMAEWGDTLPLYKDRRITNRDRLELIYELSTLLMRSLDVDQICEKVVDTLFQCLVRINSVIILLLDKETSEMKQVMARSRGGKGNVPLQYSRTIVSRVAREAKAVMMSDVSQEEESMLSQSIEAMRIKSIMCVPLVTPRGTRGVIYAHSVDMPHGFRKDDLHLFTCLSTPAALAIENALMYARSREAEIAERERAREEITSVNERLTEANRSLQVAYAQMRDWKDRLSQQLLGPSIGFLMEPGGQIYGFTEKALEITGKDRQSLLNLSIYDFLDAPSGEMLKQEMKKAWIDALHVCPLHFMIGPSAARDFHGKLMHISTGAGRKMLLLLRPPEVEG